MVPGPSFRTHGPGTAKSGGRTRPAGTSIPAEKAPASRGAGGFGTKRLGGSEDKPSVVRSTAEGAAAGAAKGGGQIGAVVGGATGLVRSGLQKGNRWKLAVILVVGSMLGLGPLVAPLLIAGTTAVAIGGFEADQNSAAYNAATQAITVPPDSIDAEEGASEQTGVPWEVLSAIIYYETGPGVGMGATPGTCPPPASAQEGGSSSSTPRRNADTAAVLPGGRGTQQPRSANLTCVGLPRPLRHRGGHACRRREEQGDRHPVVIDMGRPARPEPPG